LGSALLAGLIRRSVFHPAAALRRLGLAVANALAGLVALIRRLVFRRAAHLRQAAMQLPSCLAVVAKAVVFHRSFPRCLAVVAAAVPALVLLAGIIRRLAFRRAAVELRSE
jgi:hypothetical protein